MLSTKRCATRSYGSPKSSTASGLRWADAAPRSPARIGVICSDRRSRRIGAQLQPQPRRPPCACAVLARLKRQAHRCETTRNIETGAAFDADWLQRDRIAGATHQHIGADPNPKRSACGSASVRAGQEPWWQGDCRGDDCPDDHCILHVSDIDTEFRDRAGIVFRSTGGRHERAVQIAR